MSQDYHRFNVDNMDLVLTDEQYKIVTAEPTSNMLILACAGSGKSTTLVFRTKYLIDSGIVPERIMLTTFNVESSESLRRKLNSVFGSVPNIMVGTLDSIACRLYHRYFHKDHFIGVSEYATELLKYLETEQGKNLINKFDVVIFDEFQDINEIQYNIIKKFYDNNVKVILIGDDAQNIYQWRGSDVKYILNAKSYFSDIEYYNLSLNYRSSVEIVDFASAVIKNNTDQLIKPMNSHKGLANTLPRIQHYYSISQQSRDIILDIANLIRSKVSLDDIAILSRNNYPIKNLEEEIEKYNKNAYNPIKYVSLITNNSCDTKPKITKGCITLTTIHKAKGLEWEFVYFISCDDETIPASLDLIGIQEERRLFYVATTRSKKYLKLSFTKKTISRFVAEIDNNLYLFPSMKNDYFRYTNARSHVISTELNKIVQLVQETDIELMRKDNIIPSIKPTITKVHDSYNYHSYIDDNYLHSDFNNFITRVITRLVGKLQKNKTECRDIYAEILQNAITISREAYNSYCKYTGQIANVLEILHKKDSDIELIRKIGTVEEVDIINVIKIVRRMLEVCDIQGNKDVFVIPKNYIPFEFMQELTHHYSEYKNIKNNGNKLLQNIYVISLCENIYAGRKRLMHMGMPNKYQQQTDEENSIHDVFIKNGLDIMTNIQNNYLQNMINDELSCQTIHRSGKFNIDSVIQIYNKTQQKLIDIRCSSDNKCKLEWFVELLGEVAILREKKILIREAEIYNPIQGIIYTFDLSCWIKDELLLKTLDQIQKTKEMRGLDELTLQQYQKSIDTTKQRKIDKINNNHNEILPSLIVVPMTDPLYAEIAEINDMIINQKSMSVPAISKPVKKEITRKQILEKDLEGLLNQYEKKLEEYRTMYQQLQLAYEGQEHYVNEMKLLVAMNENKLNKPYYIVFDTETTGLPTSRLSPEQYLAGHDTARILQLSWACYDEKGDLIQVNDYLIKPTDYKVNATHIHGITEAMASTGHELMEVIEKFSNDIKKVNYLLGHNVMFDVNILKSEMIRRQDKKFIELLNTKKIICTMIKGVIANKTKFPKQLELYETLFGEKMENAHNAKYDTLNLGKIVKELRNRKVLNF